MSTPLVIAVPSKGRLKDQVAAWLADCGLRLSGAQGARGYLARIEGMDDVQVRLASAADIAAALIAGDIHLGVTGEDLLRESPEAVGDRVLLLTALGFGRADLVVAAPKSWIDVETMADLDDVARHFLARTGARLRVATKYRSQTRAFFARHGVADYRLVDSAGATEGAPAAGVAEMVVDITSSGATLAANGLRPVADGLILSSQAQLAASLAAGWNPPQLATARRIIGIIEARARGLTQAALTWPDDQDERALAALGDVAGPRLGGGVIVTAGRLFAAMESLSAAGVGPVLVTRPTHVFEASSATADDLAQAIERRHCDTSADRLRE
jgi:ATP phosphoribosyltransferase